MPKKKKESLISQVTKSKIACRQVNFSPICFTMKRAKLGQASEGSRGKVDKSGNLTSFRSLVLIIAKVDETLGLSITFSFVM